MTNEEIPIKFSMIKDFVNYRISSQSWCHSYDIHIKAFNAFCVHHYPEKEELMQEMIKTWCKQRDTELNNSCRTRIYVVVDLVKYANSRGIVNITVPLLPKIENSHYIPHIFTEMELKNLFYACDTNEIPIPRKTIINRKIMMPVLFRLLYSTGMRTTEARLLKRENVDLDTGVISIEKSKGYDQHFVVLHTSMLEVMKNYDRDIEELYPSRTYFFPAKSNGYYDKNWITNNFNKLWYRYNQSYARAYDLSYPNLYKIQTFLQGHTFYQQL